MISRIISLQEIMYFVLFALLLSVSYAAAAPKREFYVDWENDRFVKDGATFQYASAGMHYFRIPPQYWENRISAAKSAGLNAVQTYVAWNMHEPEPGKYDFNDMLDLIGFIKAVQAYDMVLILRVGPYICAEWNFGGLPPWLLSYPNMQVRTQNEDFMAAMKRWFDVLLPLIKPHLYANGGPIIMVQVENEYGSFGCDHEYISRIYTMMHDTLGDDIVYFTTDGPAGVHCGSLNTTQVLTTIDFGTASDAAALFAKLRKYQPHGPNVNSELYTGWLDHWGHKHSTRGCGKLGKAVDALLGLGASTNLYMWHGGTNFGLTSGAQKVDFWPNPTSYDYDAPQSESGDVKLDKYWAIRNVTSRYFPGNKMPVPIPWPRLTGISLKPTLKGYLIDHMTLLGSHKLPFTMEQMGVFKGLAAYQHTLEKPIVNKTVQIDGVHDRAYVLADGIFVQVVKRESKVNFTVSASKTITIIVENMGYIGFSKAMLDYSAEYKGIKGVFVNGMAIEMWEHFAIDIENLSKISNGPNGTTSLEQNRLEYSRNGKKLLERGPAVFVETVTLQYDQLKDTFVNITRAWSKGYLIVNGQLIGRYWPDAGPQYTLFVPGVYLVEGLNSFTLIELQSADLTIEKGVYLTDKPYIDGPYNKTA